MLLTPLLSLLAPHECLGCLAEGSLLCQDCRQSLTPARARCYHCYGANLSFATCSFCQNYSPLRSVYAAVRYEGLAKDLVIRLKFGRAKAAGAEIGQILAARMRRLQAGNAIVTNVPTANARVRQRGYDQAALIARAFAKQAGLPYVPLLARYGKHKQVGANKAVRSAQLQQDFVAIRQSRIRGRHILIVDDVVTTGATFEVTAAALRQAGAKSVSGVAFAQA